MESFNELNLSAPIARAIADLGYEKPSEIQEAALPILLGESTDFLGLAATGTGKTAAFGIPMLERIDPSKKGVQALILCPTRELALQVAGQIDLLGKHLGVRALPIYGGAGYSEQIQGLKRGVSVVVGTPGRLIDHMEKGTLRLDGLKTLVLDEADEMISMGFKDDLETILGSIPEGEANIWLFSATMSPDIRRVADKYLESPKMVQINRTEMIPQTVEQIYYPTQESNKPEVLCKLIEGAADEFYGLIFCQTKALVVDLTQYLKGRGYFVDCLHGDMDQNARERTMKAFRERKVSILICTDVASRGLDVKDITHVINYSIPRELDSYVHRIGRTGRIGKAGLALSLVTASQRGLIGRIERTTKSRMKEGRIPTRKEIGALKISKSLVMFQEQVHQTRVVELLGSDWKEAISEMPGEEIVGRFLAARFPEIFSAEREKERDTAPRTPGVGKILGKRGATGAPIPRPSAEGRAISPVGGSPSMAVEPLSASAPSMRSAVLKTASLKPSSIKSTLVTPALVTPASVKPEAVKPSPMQLTVDDSDTDLLTEAEPVRTFAGKPIESLRVTEKKSSKAPWGVRDAKGLESRGGFSGDFKGDYKVKKPRWEERKPFGAPRSEDRKPFGAPRGEKRAWGDKPRFGSRPAGAGEASGYGAPKARWAKPSGGAARPFGTSSDRAKPSPFGKPREYGKPSAYGSKPSAYGSKPSAYGKPSSYSKPSGFASKPSGGFADRPLKRERF